MNNWRKDYIRGFIAMIGVGLIYAGIVSTKLLPPWFYASFILIGLGLVGAAVYWWYKDSQKGG